MGVSKVDQTHYSTVTDKCTCLLTEASRETDFVTSLSNVKHAEERE